MENSEKKTTNGLHADLRIVVMNTDNEAISSANCYWEGCQGCLVEAIAAAIVANDTVAAMIAKGMALAMTQKANQVKKVSFVNHNLN